MVYVQQRVTSFFWKVMKFENFEIWASENQKFGIDVGTVSMRRFFLFFFLGGGGAWAHGAQGPQ